VRVVVVLSWVNEHGRCAPDARHCGSIDSNRGRVLVGCLGVCILEHLNHGLSQYINSDLCRSSGCRGRQQGCQCKRLLEREQGHLEFLNLLLQSSLCISLMLWS
jgi:hypothetical protein